MLLLTLHAALASLSFIFKSPTILPNIESIPEFTKCWYANFDLAVSMSKDIRIADTLNAAHWERLQDFPSFQHRNDSTAILFSLLEEVFRSPTVEEIVKEYFGYEIALYSIKTLAVSITDNFRLLDMAPENWKRLQAITRTEIISTAKNQVEFQNLTVVSTKCIDFCEKQENIQNKYLELTNTDNKELRNLFWGLNPSSSDSAIGFLQMGYLLKLPFLAKKSSIVLQQNLSMENVIQIFQLAAKTGMKDLKEKSEEFILLEFEDISRDDENFLSIKGGELFSLLMSEKLNSPNENSVFKAIVRWVQADLFARKEYITTLMKAVRLHLCSLSLLNIMLSHHLLADLESVQKNIRTAIYLIQLKSSKLPELVKKEQRQLHETLFVIGGVTNLKTAVTVETFSTTKQQWIYNERFDNGTTARTSAISSGKTILVFDHERFSVSSFDPIKKEWKFLSSVPNNRKYFGVAELDGQIYVLGGQTSSATNLCDRYDLITNSWTKLPNLNTLRNFAASATFQGKVYMAGGHDGSKFYNTVEVFDEDTNRWNFINPMNILRHRFALVPEGNNLWAFGGHTGSAATTTFERFSTETGTWVNMGTHPIPHYQHTVVYFLGNFYLIGDVGKTTNVDIYNPRRNTWKAGSAMNFGRYDLGACTVHNLPNAFDYLVYENSN